MGWHWRKSKKFGPFRITASKSGISTSIGGKGFRLTQSTNGKTQVTTGIPGTGLYHTQTLSSSEKKQCVRNNGRLSTIVIIVLIFMIIGVMIFLRPHNGTLPDPMESQERPVETTAPFVFVDDIASVFLSTNGYERIGCQLHDVSVDKLHIINENPEIADINIDNIAEEGVSLTVTALSSGTGFFSLTDGAYTSERICVVVENSSNGASGTTSSTGGTYIANKNTGVYHRSSCSALPDTENREYISANEAAEGDYTPCQICKP